MEQAHKYEGSRQSDRVVTLQALGDCQPLQLWGRQQGQEFFQSMIALILPVNSGTNASKLASFRQL